MNEKKQKTIETYDASAHAMRKKFADIGVRVDDVKRAFSFCEKKDPRVLEIGCGYGREATEIIQHTHHYLGIDVSKVFVDLARIEVPTARFEVADIEEYTFPKNLDILFAFASLLHSDREQVKIIFEKAHRALNPNGIFYISLKFGNYEEVFKKDEFGERVYFTYTPEDIKNLAGDGFKSIYEDVQQIHDQKWFTMCLKKI